jgi:hypothetical protein
MRFDAERLQRLLPAVYRLRDAQQGGPLAGLLSVLAEQIGLVEHDLDRLYDDQFIETCADWAVPYIGDLVGYRPLALHGVTARVASPRAEVAHTIAYRRRKGTAAMLEQLARDVTGWDARAVEFFRLLATTQYLNHIRVRQFAAPDLRHMGPLESLGTPFETVGHTLEVRRLATGRGRYNIPNIGLCLWRLRSFFTELAAPRPVTDPADGRYWFHPLGLDVALFNRPHTETDLAQLADEAKVSDALARRRLHREVEELRQAAADGRPATPVFLGERPAFTLFSAGVPIPATQIVICDLSGWSRPPATRTYEAADGTSVVFPIRAAVDPALGRIAFPAAESDPVRVSYAYGFSGELGGGPYDRQPSAAVWLESSEREVSWQIGVTQDPETLAAAPDPAQLVTTLADAVAGWNAHRATHPNGFGIITVMDNATYEEDLTGSNRLEVPAGARLAVVAANWPVREVPGSPGQFQRVVGEIVPNGRRAHLRGDISASGPAGAPEAEPGELILDGLLIEGSLRVLVGDLGRLRLAHTTLVPAEGGITVNPSVTSGQQNDGLTILLERTISGPINLPDSVPGLRLRDSIVDPRGAGMAIAAPGAEVEIESSTVLDGAAVRTLMLSNSIVTGPITSARRQTGCARFSHVPAGSLTPRRYRCQPDLALQGVTDPALRGDIEARIAPVFTTLAYGQPGYGQLGARCAREIRTGAEDGSEMGAFNFLKQPQRETNLRIRLAEYVRVGLETGILYRT